ncbi:FkbM family methyltransferase [Maridesulfovibrio salexigens]|uniref:FkbM family methyltransferase n=1 Tax=Maridesulfovibrio salexigens TaxID=880 RepID=UPI0002D9D99B|nr:FkbM family methyltransferase [Maridesulfovibrio salexigens]
MSRQEILEQLKKNNGAWRIIPSVIKNDQGEPEFDMLLANAEMQDPGTASLNFRETRCGGFEYASRAFLHAHLEPGDLFIDVGAHFGLYTLTAAKKYPGKINVLAIEPHPENLKRLSMWCEFNECVQNVKIAQCAASSQSGQSELIQNSSMGHSLVPQPGNRNQGKPISVRLETIDNIVRQAGFMDSKERIFLKIDTEGHELATLMGGLDILKTGRVAAIIWEKGHFHNSEKGIKEFASIMGLLRDMGYESYRFPHEDMGGPLVPYSPSHELCNVISIDRSLTPLPVYDQPWTAHTIMSPSMRPPVSENFMIGFTEQLIKDKKTDCGRWSRWDMLGTEADLRAGMAGQLVPENSSVLDAGAGMMLLRDYIPESSTYTPLDIVARNRNTIIADLNQQQFPEQDFDVICALYLLEFIHEPQLFLDWSFKHADKLILIYHPLVPGREVSKRRQAGFFNDFNINKLKLMVEKAGWKEVRISDITFGQACFECLK